MKASFHRARLMPLAALAALCSWSVQASMVVPALPQQASFSSSGDAVADGAGDLVRLSQRLFAEPLFAVGQSPSAENRALRSALSEYATQPDARGLVALDAFLLAHPDSAWAVSLHANLGQSYRDLGYFSQARAHWSQAWSRGRELTAFQQQAQVNEAVSHWVFMEAQLGNAAQVSTLLGEIGDRPLPGSAGAYLSQAKAGYWSMQHEPERALRCGLVALQHALPGASQEALRRLENMPAGVHGTNLQQLADLSAGLGVSASAVSANARFNDVPVPSIVHWKVGHFAAIVGREGDAYRVIDPALGGEMTVQRDVLQRESSGDFLVFQSQLPKGWQALSQAEASRIRGAGNTSSSDPKATSPCDSSDSGACDSTNPVGMASYRIHSLLASLSINDTPLKWTPPVGPGMQFTLSYSQSEANQPATFTYTNLGQNWTTNWVTYITDSPTSAGTSVTLYEAGGGLRSFSGYSSGTGAFTAQSNNGAHLVMTSASPITYTLTYQDGTVETYSESDGAVAYPRKVFLSSRTDPQGNQVALSYDDQLRITSVSDAIGQQMSFSYGSAEDPLRLTSVTDPFGRTATLGYDDSGRLTSITDVIGMTSSFSYDGTDTFIDAMTTPYGTTSFTRYESGEHRWLEATDPEGQTERVEYYEAASGIPYSDSPTPSGMTLFNSYINYRNSFYWDKSMYAEAHNASTGVMDYTKAQIKHFLHDASNTNMTGRVLESVKLPLDRRVWFNYDGQSWGGITGTRDVPSKIGRVLPDGTTQLVSNTYNEYNRLTQTTDAMGRITQYEYASNGIDLVAVKQVGPNGTETLASYTYNAHHKPLTSTDASGATTTYNYNDAGQITSVTDALGNVTRYEYDGANRLQQVINALGVPQHGFTYDSVGRVASETDSEGYTQSYEYDKLDRVTEVGYPDGSTRVITWDKLDVGSVKDRYGRTTSYSHDAARNLTAVTNPLGLTVTYGYYPNGSLKQLTDARGNSTIWTRDLQSRVTGKTLADGSSQTWTYDSNGRSLTRTDALGQVTLYNYDQGDELSGLSYSNTVNPTPDVSFVYDPYYPRLDSMSDGNGVTTFAYVPAGAVGALSLQSENGAYDNDQVSYQYDALGRVTSRTVDSSTETFAFDVLGRVTAVDNDLGHFSYDYLGQTEQVTNRSLNDGDGFGIRYNYYGNSGDRRLLSVSYLAPGSKIPTRSQIFHYDAAARLAGERAQIEGETAEITRYQYDDLDRLLAVRKDRSKAESYAYDAAGNLTTANSPKGDWAFDVDALNRVTSANGTAWQYDANGNLIDDGDRSFAWDAENRLISVTQKATGHVTSYRYDGFSRRVAIIDQDTGAEATEIRYTWCGEQGPCQRRNASDKVNGHYFDQGYIHGSDSHYYTTDFRGGVNGALDSSGAMESAWSFTAYGQLQKQQTSGKGPFRYAGMFYDSDAGLYLTHYRAYDPASGRWLSPDPMQEAGGYNLYAYVDGNPISRIDPQGEFFLPLITGAIGGAAGFIGNLAVQLYSNHGDLSCVKWSNALIAGGVGAVAGALAPVVATSWLGAAALGAAANTVQYDVTQVVNGDSTSGVDALWNATTGAVGGLLGGVIKAPSLSWATDSPWIPTSLARSLNRDAWVSANSVTKSGLARSVGGGVVSNSNRPGSGDSSCGCGN